MSTAPRRVEDHTQSAWRGPRAEGPCNAAPRLLVSCRDANEAMLALVGGADWIDLKEPARGALGGVSIDAARRVAEAIPPGFPLSAAVGELLDWPQAAAQQLLQAPRVEYLKLGLAGCRVRRDWRGLWRRTRDEVLRAGKGLVAVAYADSDAAASPSCAEVAEFAIAEQCPIFLVDTFSKGNATSATEASGRVPRAPDSGSNRVRNLFELIDVDTLANLFRAVRRAHVIAAVAGSLDQQTLSHIPWRQVDVVAVRGAACSGGRNGMVDPCRVAELQEALQRLAPFEAGAWSPEHSVHSFKLPGNLS